MKFLDQTGLTYLWNKIKGAFIRTVNGVGPDENGNVSIQAGLPETPETYEFTAGQPAYTIDADMSRLYKYGNLVFATIRFTMGETITAFNSGLIARFPAELSPPGVVYAIAPQANASLSSDKTPKRFSFVITNGMIRSLPSTYPYQNLVETGEQFCVSLMWPIKAPEET